MHRRPVIVFAAVMLACAAAWWLPGTVWGAPPDTLGRALELVRRARGETGEQQGETVADARRILVADADLQGALPWLMDPLTHPTPDLERAESLLQAALTAATVPAAHVPDTELARAALRAILDAPPFTQHHWTEQWPAWLRPALLFVSSAWAWVTAEAGRLLLLAVRLLFDFLQTPFAAIGGLAVVAGLVLLYRFALRSAIVREAATPALADAADMTADDALGRAQALFEAGAYREASHYLLASVLLWCDGRGWMRFDPSKTNREHLAQVREHPGLRTRLTPLVNRFDRVWYGQAAVTAQDYRALADLAAGVREYAA